MPRARSTTCSAAAFPWCAGWEAELRALFAAFVEAKQHQRVLDYDDLLLYWAHMMAEPAIAADISSRFDHVLVDEYQDTNRLQASILLALKPNGRGLTIVGDDAQSIYSFRSATVRNILDFPGQFSPPRRCHHARTELSLDAADPRRGQCRHRIGGGAFYQEPLVGPRLRRAAAAGQRRRRSPARRATWPSRFCTIAKPASRSRRRRCCSALPITAGLSKSS